MEAYARTILAHVLVEQEGPAAGARIDGELTRAVSMIDATGARTFLPHVHEIRARLAQRTGDGTSFERELREAHRLFAEIGAAGHAERIAKELGR